MRGKTPRRVAGRAEVTGRVEVWRTVVVGGRVVGRTVVVRVVGRTVVVRVVRVRGRWVDDVVRVVVVVRCVGRTAVVRRRGVRASSVGSLSGAT